MPLKRDNFLPDLDAIPKDIAKKAKLLFINYPNNPTSAIAEKDFYIRVIDFAVKNNIIVAVMQHIQRYILTTKPMSFLEVDKGKRGWHRIPFPLKDL